MNKTVNKSVNKVCITLAILGLAGCSASHKTEIREQPVPVVCDLSARPDALDLIDTPPTLVMDGEVWGYWFSAERYGAIAENIQAMRRWMSQSRAIRQRLIDCIESHNAAAGASNNDRL